MNATILYSIKILDNVKTTWLRGFVFDKRKKRKSTSVDAILSAQTSFDCQKFLELLLPLLGIKSDQKEQFMFIRNLDLQTSQSWTINVGFAGKKWKLQSKDHVWIWRKKQKTS